MVYFVSSRFNNETWESSVNYRIKHNFSCIYAPPTRLASSILPDESVFVVEMNNSLNEIMGIGLIKNKLTYKTHRVYSDNNLNRYIYIGEYHMTREELDMYNPFLSYVLDQILFRGYTHSKRGYGFTKIPEKVLKLDVCEGLDVKKEIKKIFVTHFRDKLREKMNKPVHT